MYKELKGWFFPGNVPKRAASGSPDAVARAYSQFTQFLVRTMTDALVDGLFLAEVRRCPEAHKKTLQNAWLCVLVWAHGQALRQCFEDRPETVGDTLTMMIGATASHQDWFDGEMCEAMHRKMDEFMPTAWDRKGELGMAFPVADWSFAVASSGHPNFANEYRPDMQFAIFFAIFLPKLIIEVRDTVKKIMAI